MRKPTNDERAIDARRQEAGISASCTVQGKTVEYKTHLHRTTKVGGERKDIIDFSQAARLRMLKKLNKIDYLSGARPLFMTLTYPDAVAHPDLHERNLHRKLMARHLEKLTGKPVAACWRVEWVPRQSGIYQGAFVPHWHWLIFNHDFIAWQKVNELWKRTIGQEGYVRTDIRRVDETGVVQQYMAKYIAKEAVPLSLVIRAYQRKVGRSYGWLREGEIPWAKVTKVHHLSDAHRATLTSLASEKSPLVSEHAETSWTLFGDVARDVEKILAGLPLTHP